MKKALLAAAVLVVASPAAWAVEVLLPNGSFEANDPPGFGQSITNWTVSFTGTPAGSIPSSEQSGIFTSFGKFAFAPDGGQFALLSNLGGGGDVTLTSGAAGNNFFVNDRLLGFRYAYITSDPPGTGARDEFRVHIDFFSSATSTTVIGMIDQIIQTQGTFGDTSIGVSPFAAGGPTTIYNDSPTTGFNFIAVDIEQFFGSFARVSFIVNDGGPAAGTNGNGLGVSGIVLDGVILTPEPSAVGLFALGALGLGGFVWRRKRPLPVKPAA